MTNMPPNATEFFETVWKIVRLIPAGQVSTYGQIASMIPPPDGVEPGDYDRLGPVWVGKAMNAVSFKDDRTIPWQRVINSQGGISLPEGSRVAADQKTRLQNEGVRFGKSEKVDLNAFGWDGPDEAWLREHGLFAPRPIKKGGDTPNQLSLF
jgi:methylated-DNA-protein-cysteine methyltransferase-like protein